MNPGTYLLVLVIGTIGAAIALVHYRDLIFSVNTSGRPTSSPAAPRRSADLRPGRRRSARPARTRRERVQTLERHHNAELASVQGSSASVQGSHVHTDDVITDDVIMSADELKRLTLAIVIYTQTRNEQTAIQEAFDCTKGGSKRWKRAKLLFDMAAPAPALAPNEQIAAT